MIFTANSIKASIFVFLYKQTEIYYGSEGQSSIDPVVFFKICMVGYLHNIVSDRTLIRFCADSLSVRLYLGYDLDEDLLWHSTISRTRKLFGEEVFLSLFQEVLRLCCRAVIFAVLFLNSIRHI
jgi:Transposase and inactivated derivatives